MLSKNWNHKILITLVLVTSFSLLVSVAYAQTDDERIAQLQKQKFVPTLDNPAGAVNNVLGLLKGKNEPPANPEQPAKPASETPKPSGLKGLLDSLGKKKP